MINKAEATAKVGLLVAVKKPLPHFLSLRFLFEDSPSAASLPPGVYFHFGTANIGTHGWIAFAQSQLDRIYGRKRVE